jgi:hypothetical protein
VKAAMNENLKQKLWQSFTNTHSILASSVPLFAVSDSGVEVFHYGANRRPILRRSADMDELMRGLGRQAVNQFNSPNPNCDGVLYMMFRAESTNVIPLYIGKAELYGKSERNLSVNISDLVSGVAMFGRWGYNYAYHIGDLSAATLPGHPEEKRTPKYLKWSSMLFDFDEQTVKPKFDIRFWATLWTKDCQSIWHDFGPTRLTFEEYLLIGIASDLFPSDLLNNEGRNR